jgi:hypothetical protein
MITRKHGSQRASKPKTVQLEPNFCGQNGSEGVTLKTEDGWIVLTPESEEETRQLMSVAQCVFRNNARRFA